MRNKKKGRGWRGELMSASGENGSRAEVQKKSVECRIGRVDGNVVPPAIVELSCMDLMSSNSLCFNVIEKPSSSIFKEINSWIMFDWGNFCEIEVSLTVQRVSIERDLMPLATNCRNTTSKATRSSINDVPRGYHK